MKKFILFLICTSFLVSCKNDADSSSASKDSARTDDPITTKIAMANGYENFQDVKQLNFTFNVKANDTLRSSRSWKWYPQEEKVELTENNETSSYINDGQLEESERAIDQKFINDTYWLLFPYQLVWSEYEMEHNRSAVAPISQEPMQQLTIKFENDGGYTPGDTYHLFFTNDNMIQEWTYESSEGRTLTTTWEDYETFDGITIAKTHKSEDGSFELFFSDIEVIK